MATNPGDIVLDSFAGSGTTGHAVLKMNAAGRSGILPDTSVAGILPAEANENGQDARSTGDRQNACPAARRFILVEMEARPARGHSAQRTLRHAA
ncbi:MAG: DNA methyltransferase [Prosthecobacter sp.]|nr:DNA methyltransferase [Prosthecobacter sp.]